MDTAVLCVLCGAPFALEPSIYHLDPNRAEFKWLYDVQLVAPASAFRNHCLISRSDDHQIPYQDDSLVVSEVISWSMTDANCFLLQDSYYFVLEGDDSGDVLFPLHEKCIKLADRAFEFRRSDQAPAETRSSSVCLYDALKSHYSTARSIGVSMYPNALGLLTNCDLFSYRAIDMVDNIGWWGGAYERFLSDPIAIINRTQSICNMLRRSEQEPPASPPFDICLQSQRYHGLEALPNELLDQIVNLLPARSAVALHCSSKSLAHKVVIDNKFWKARLCDGSALSHIWDLEVKEMKRFIVLETIWDWKSLIRCLAVKTSEDQTSKDTIPRGLWNRRRIFDRIEGTLMRPPNYRADLPPASCGFPESHGSQHRFSLSTLVFFGLLMIIAAWDLQF